MRAAGAGTLIRPMEGLEESMACVRLQEEVWGEDFGERVPVSLLMAARRLGGLVAGAFDGKGRLLGFVFGVTGLQDGEVVHWSDMLAVRPGLRDQGLGRRLKAYQREHCLRLGIRRCYWTFDPLESRNAHLNLGRLGAVAREYVVDMYGESSSPLHRGIGTDRLVALWEVDSDRVEERLVAGRDPHVQEGSALPCAFPVEERTDGLPVPGAAPGRVPEGSDPPCGAFLVPVPRSIQEVKDRDPELALRWRRATRAVLRPALKAGWEVRELLRAPARSWSAYLLLPRSTSKVGVRTR